MNGGWQVVSYSD